MSLSTTYTEDDLEKYIFEFSFYECNTEKEKRFYGCLQLMVWIYLNIGKQEKEQYIGQIFIYMYESAKVQVKLEPAPNSKEVFENIINKHSSSSAFRLIDKMSGLKLGLSTDSVENSYQKEYKEAEENFKKLEKEHKEAENNLNELEKEYKKALTISENVFYPPV